MKRQLSPRTDLALESCDSSDGRLPEGVFVDEQTIGKITKTVVRIDTEGAARRLGRPRGSYLTLEGDFSLYQDELCGQLREQLEEMLPEGPALVLGLGNRDITPDEIGPLAASRVMATRHLFSEQLERLGLGGLRSVCVLAPGVMGQTGLEVSDILKALLKEERFGSVIAVDALAARSSGRLGNTIQLCDSGISPGSGVLNRRAELSRDTLGLPVLAIGIPTVVDAATLIGDLCPDCRCGDGLPPMMVTPRNIDAVTRNGAKIISRAINLALQPDLSEEEIDALLS